MSLLDALLLEPYRDPKEIYIALRSDGQLGSGTASDPYSGDKRAGTAFQGMTLTFNKREFLATAYNHGLSPSSNIKISGVRGPDADKYNRTWLPTEFEFLGTHHIKFTLPSGVADLSAPPDAPRGDYRLNDSIAFSFISWPLVKVALPAGHGLVEYDVVSVAEAPPFNGDVLLMVVIGNDAYFRLLPQATLPTSTGQTCTVSEIIYGFDEVMAPAPAGTLVRIGPGTFETRGHIRWEAKSKQRILGSGMALSVLKLVFAPPLDLVPAIGNPVGGYAASGLLDGFEVSDLCIDCNLKNQIACYGDPYAIACCAAIGVFGSHMRVSRVRAINFGPQTPHRECFVIYMNNFQGAIHNIVEDCVLEEPNVNNARETTLIGNVGHSPALNAKSLIVRNNYVDCSYLVGNPPTRVSPEHVRIKEITYEGTDLAVIETHRPHHRAVDGVVVMEYVWRQPVLPETIQQPSSFIGAFRVVAVVDGFKFKIKKPPGAPASDDDLVLSPAPHAHAHLGVLFHSAVALGGTGCVTEGNALYNSSTAVYSDAGGAMHAIVRNNYYSGVQYAVRSDFSGSSHGPFSSTGIVKRKVAGGTTAEFHCIRPHELDDEDTVIIRGLGLASPDASDPYQKQTQITVIDPYTFSYPLADGAQRSAPNPLTFLVPIITGSAGLTYTAGVATFEASADHGLQTGDFVQIYGTNPETEGLEGTFQITVTTGTKFTYDIVLSSSGAVQAKADLRVNTPLRRAGSQARFDSGTPLEISTKDIVWIQGAYPRDTTDDPLSNPYNGFFAVESVSDPDTPGSTDQLPAWFTYQLRTTPSGSETGAAGNALNYRAPWRFHQFTIENNVCELYAFDANSVGLPAGISMFGLGRAEFGLNPPVLDPAQYVELIIQGNVMRLDNDSPPPPLPPDASPRSFGVHTVGSALIQHNLFALRNPQEISYQSSQRINAFHNLDRNQQAVLTAELISSAPTIIHPPRLETAVEDALTMALL